MLLLVGVYWVVGLIPEDLELSRKILSFLKKNQLVTQFSAAIGTDTKFHDLKKGILRTVRFRFEMTTISNLEKQYSKTCQIARL